MCTNTPEKYVHNMNTYLVESLSNRLNVFHDEIIGSCAEKYYSDLCVTGMTILGKRCRSMPTTTLIKFGTDGSVHYSQTQYGDCFR